MLCIPEQLGVAMCRISSSSETLIHVLQVCYATHRPRIKRHDNIVDYVIRGLHQRGFTAHKEPSFNAFSAEGESLILWLILKRRLLYWMYRS